jgi:hypothetical protein
LVRCIAIYSDSSRNGLLVNWTRYFHSYMLQL